MKTLFVLAMLCLISLPIVAQGTIVRCATEEDTVGYDFYRVGLARGNDELASALGYINCVLKETPNNAMALRLRGTIHLDLGNTEAAVTDFNASLDLNPNDPIAFNNRGYAVLQFKWYDLAINDLNRAIDLDPTYARPYNNRGLVYEALGNYSEALGDFRRAIELKHEPSWWPRWNMVMIYQKLNEDVNVMGMLNDLIETSPDYLESYRVMGELLSEQGRPEEAQTYLDRYYGSSSATSAPMRATAPYIYREDPTRIALKYVPVILIILILSGFVGGAFVEWWQRR